MNPLLFARRTPAASDFGPPISAFLFSPQRAFLNLSLLAFVATLLSAAGNAFGAAITITASTTWSAITTGSGTGGQPNSSDTITVQGGATLTMNVSSGACASIQLGGTSSGSGAGILTFNSGSQVTVSGVVTIGGGSGSPTGSINMTSGGTLICQGFTLSNFGSWSPGAGAVQLTADNTLPTSGLTTFNNLTINGGTTTMGVGLTVTNLTITAGTFNTSTSGNCALTLVGNFSNSGTFTANGSALAVSGTNTQTIAGFTTTGTVSMTKTAGTATFSGNVSGGALTINGSGGTLNLGTGLTHTFAGTWTTTAGTLDGSSSTLNLGGSVSGTGGAFTASTGTVSYNAAGAQTIAAVTYHNLVFSGGGAKSMVTGTSVTGNLSIATTGTATASVGTGLNLSVGSLTLGGLGRVNGTWGSTTATPATHQNNTYFAGNTGYLIVSTDTRSTPTVSTWPTASAITYGQTLASSTLSGGSASVSGTFCLHLVVHRAQRRNSPAERHFRADGHYRLHDGSRLGQRDSEQG